MNNCPALAQIAAPLAPPRPAPPGSGLLGVTVPVLLSLMVAAGSFWYAREAGAGASEYHLTLRSALLASLAALPVMCYALSGRGTLERGWILLWWPLKIGFLLYYYFHVWDALENPTLYLRYSDHMPFHLWARRVSDYWQHTGALLIPKKTLFEMSVNYPGAGYLFGAMYHCLGRYPGVVLPWLTLCQFQTAVLAQRVLELVDLPRREAKVACHLVLWSPVLWVLTLLIHRDIFIIFSLLLLLGATALLLRGALVPGMAGIVAAVVLLANLRAELLYLVLVWFVLVFLFGGGRFGERGLLVRVTALAALCLVALFVGWTIFGEGSALYNAKFDLGSKLGKMTETYFRQGASASGIYGGVLALGGVFLLPVVLPFKLLIGVTAPFPWRFGTYQLLVTQPFYSLESILRIALLSFSLRACLSWSRVRELLGTPLFLPVSLGGLMALGALLGPQSEVRYLTPVFPLLVPLYARQVLDWRSFVPALLWACFAIALLHAGYLVVRGGL